jgi:NAD+ kinase
MPSTLLAAIISKPQKPELTTILRDLITWLESHHYEYVLDPESATYVQSSAGVKRQDLPQRHPNLVIVLGGDGTLLAAARVFAKTTTPILSVNLGSLGFLTEIPLSELYDTLQAWCDNSAGIELRRMMHVELHREGNLFQVWDVLNDVVVAKGAIARMVEFLVEIDGQFVASFRADGIIVSTPTGSTAYNLAAAGPIVLTIRPIVVPGDSIIQVGVVGVPNETYLTVDGQEAVSLVLGDMVLCRRSEYSVRLLRLHPNGLFNVLRSKLKWGER